MSNTKWQLKDGKINIVRENNYSNLQEHTNLKAVKNINTNEDSTSVLQSNSVKCNNNNVLSPIKSRDIQRNECLFIPNKVCEIFKGFKNGYSNVHKLFDSFLSDEESWGKQLHDFQQTLEKSLNLTPWKPLSEINHTTNLQDLNTISKTDRPTVEVVNFATSVNRLPEAIIDKMSPKKQKKMYSSLKNKSIDDIPAYQEEIIDNKNNSRPTQPVDDNYDTNTMDQLQSVDNDSRHRPTNKFRNNCSSDEESCLSEGKNMRLNQKNNDLTSHSLNSDNLNSYSSYVIKVSSESEDNDSDEPVFISNQTLESSPKKSTNIQLNCDRSRNERISKNEKNRPTIMENKTNLQLDVNEDFLKKNEIWLMQCPINVNLNSLKGQSLNVPGRTVVHDNGVKYECYFYQKDSEHYNINLAVTNTKNRPSLYVMPVAGQVIIEEKVEIPEIMSIQIYTKPRIPFPVGLKTRHPLLGVEYDNQPRTSLTDDSFSSPKKKKKKHSKRESLYSDDGGGFVDVVKSSKKKRKRSEVELEESNYSEDGGEFVEVVKSSKEKRKRSEVELEESNCYEEMSTSFQDEHYRKKKKKKKKSSLESTF